MRLDPLPPSTCVHISLIPSPLRVDVINRWPLMTSIHNQLTLKAFVLNTTIKPTFNCQWAEADFTDLQSNQITSQSMFWEKFMTADFDRNISFVTSLTETRLQIFISSLKNVGDSFLQHQRQIVVFSTFFQLPMTKVLISPKIFPFHPQKFWWLFSRRLFFNFFTHFHPITVYSSLHTFVHHCTFCASLHVKTCPVTSEDR